MRSEATSRYTALQRNPYIINTHTHTHTHTLLTYIITVTKRRLESD